MAISSFEGQEVKYVPSSREVKANILAPGPWIKKLRTLCFLKPLKLKKRKCLYFFDPWPRSQDIAISSLEAREVEYVASSRGEDANISAPGPWIKKQRSLSFLQLLKCEKAKCPMFFEPSPRGQDIGIYSPWWRYVLHFLTFKRWNGHISAPGPQIKKIRTLSFLQLLKFEKAKCP